MAGEEIGHAFWTLSARMDQLERDMAKAEGVVTKGVDSAADKSSASLKKVEANVTKFSLATTAAFVGLGAVALKTFTGFEFALDQVGAVANATEADMDSLRGVALQLGADTAFSATEAANAMEELAAGGRSVAQIVGGEARAAVSLAAAGNYELAASATTIATTMDIWKDTTLDTTDVVNRLAGAANVSKFGVDDMAAAIAQGGGVAMTAGVNFQDFSTAIAATASSFSSGSDAGTAFKTFVIGLTGNSEQAKAAISELGLSFYDAQGAMRPMSEIVQELHDKLGPLSQEMQTTYLKQIFGNDAFRTAAGLMKMTGAEFEDMSDTLKRSDAAEIAARRMDNLSGDLEQLTGSAETAAIGLGEQLAPAAREAAQGATAALNAFAGLPPEMQRNILVLGTMTAALPALISGIGKAGSAIGGLSDFLKTGRGRLTAFAVGIGAVTLALDTALQMGTGHGLIDRVFGDVSKMEAAEKAMQRFNDVTFRLSDSGAKVNAIMAEMGRVADETAPKQDAFSNAVLGSDNRLFGFNVGLSDSVDNWKEYSAIVRDGASAMEANGATADQLLTVYNSLSDELQGAFLEGLGLTEDGLKNLSTQTEEYAQMMADAELETAGMATEQEKLGATVTDTAADIANGNAALDLYRAAIEDGTDAASAFEEALATMLGPLTTMSPEVIRLNTDIAILDRQIGTLENSTGKLTEAQEAELQALKDQRDELAGVRDEYSNTVSVVDEYAEELSQLSGAPREAILELGDAILDTGADGTELDRIMGELTMAMRETDSSEAVAQILALQDTLEPSEWEAVASALGPALMGMIESGLADGPARVALIAEFQSLGLSAGEGLALGMRLSIPDAQMAAAELANAGVQAAAGPRGIDSSSPSKKFIRLGEYVGEGFAIGIDNNAGMSLEAVSRMIMDAREYAENEAPTIGEAFQSAMEESQFAQGLIDTFGEYGADAAGALTDALTTKDPRYADALVDAVNEMVERAEKEGVPNARATGKAILDALLAALAAGDPALVDIALGMIDTFDATIEAHAEEPAMTLMEGFRSGYEKAKTAAAMEEKLGADGARFIEAMIDGVKEKEPEALVKLGDTAEALLSELTEGMSPSKGAAITEAFTDAVLQYIETGGAEWLQKLKDILAEIEATGQAGKALGEKGEGGQPVLAGYKNQEHLQRSDPVYRVGDSYYMITPDGRKFSLGRFDPQNPDPNFHGNLGIGQAEYDIGWQGGYDTDAPVRDENGYFITQGQPVLPSGLPDGTQWRPEYARATTLQSNPTINVYPERGLDEGQVATLVVRTIDEENQRAWGRGGAQWGNP